MKNYMLFFIMFLSLSSCLTDNNNTVELIIDSEEYNYLLNWKESKIKTGDGDWKNITDGQQLSFFFNHVGYKLGLPNNGKIRYETKANVNIKDQSYFERTDSTFVIYSTPLPETADTLILGYNLVNHSTLILRDATVSPVVEIEYKR